MLSKKNSREINVDDEHYRWAIADDGEYLVLAIQHAHLNGQRVETIIRGVETLETGEPDVSKTTSHRAVTPALVAGIVRRARTLGWMPDTKRAPLELTLNEQDQFVVRRNPAAANTK